MRLHVDQSEGFFEKNYEHSARDPVLIKSVFMHVRLLRKHERWVLKAYTYAKMKLCEIQPSDGVFDPSPAILAVKKFEILLIVSFDHLSVHCEKAMTLLTWLV